MPDRQRLGRGLELGLCLCGIAWAAVALFLAERSALGITVRLHVLPLVPLLTSLFFLFLLTLGFQLLDWIATRNGDLAEALPLVIRPGWTGEWRLGAAIGWGLCLVVVLPVLLTGNLHAAVSPGLRHPGTLMLEIATLLAVTLAQEAVFRGFLFQRLAASVGPSWSAILSSLLFAVFTVRAGNPASPVLASLNAFLLGLLLSSAVLRTFSIAAAWGLHFAYRAIMLVVLGLPAAGHMTTVSMMDTFASGPAWLSGGAFGLDDALWTLPMLLVAAAVLYRTTREYAWQYTFRPVAGAGYVVTVAPPPQHQAMEAQSQASAPLVQIAPSTSHQQSILPPRNN